MSPESLGLENNAWLLMHIGNQLARYANVSILHVRKQTHCLIRSLHFCFYFWSGWKKAPPSKLFIIPIITLFTAPFTLLLRVEKSKACQTCHVQTVCCKQSNYLSFNGCDLKKHIWYQTLWYALIALFVCMCSKHTQRYTHTHLFPDLKSAILTPGVSVESGWAALPLTEISTCCLSEASACFIFDRNQSRRHKPSSACV